MDKNNFDEFESISEEFFEDEPDLPEGIEYNDEEIYEPEYGGWSIRKRLIGVAICLVLLVALVVVGIVLYNYELQPVNVNNTEPDYVYIEDGMVIKDVAKLLKDNDLVRNEMVFTSYAGRHSYGGAQIQAATYELNQSMSTPEIFTKLVNGDSYQGPMSQIVFPEGQNLNEMAATVEASGFCTADEYKAEASDINKWKPDFPILDSIPEDEIPERTLEGYLFPDTYEVAGTGTDAARSLVEKQLAKFTEIYTPSMKEKTEADGKTVDDIVILASIVELETKLPEDKATAASVFYNRMAQNIPLQSDITIDYINGTKTPVLTTEQTQVQSPYNTYINLGLPLGPICSPGVASIDAALNPAQTDYLYFVADMSTGKLHFNTTLEGHNQDVQTYLGNQ